jgi:hypothetical protein
MTYRLQDIITCLTRPLKDSKMGYANGITWDFAVPISAYDSCFISNNGLEIRLVILTNAILILSKLPNRRGDRLLFAPMSLNNVWILSHQYQDKQHTKLCNKFEIHGPLGWKEIVSVSDFSTKQTVIARMQALGLNIIDSECKLINLT